MNRSSEEHLLISGPAGELEILVTRVAEARAVAVICHPHPLHGGTMHNKVVSTLMRAARDQGASTVRFNFRGVGQSTGRHADGVGETEDCKAVTDWAAREFPGLPLWLMGFSFGGYVAAAAASSRTEVNMVRFADTGHFFHGKLVELKAAVEEVLR